MASESPRALVHVDPCPYARSTAGLQHFKSACWTKHQLFLGLTVTGLRFGILAPSSHFMGFAVSLCILVALLSACEILGVGSSLFSLKRLQKPRQRWGSGSQGRTAALSLKRPEAGVWRAPGAPHLPLSAGVTGRWWEGSCRCYSSQSGRRLP